LPPDTTIEVKLHMNKNVIDSIFHPTVKLVDNYFKGDVIPDDIAGQEIKLTFQEVTLEYESGVMRHVDHLATLKRFTGGSVAVYTYDIPRGQHQALVHSQSYTENNFQIMPQCRLMYIMFCPDWATFNMEAQKKPLSGLSRYPAKATAIQIGFAGEESLVTKRFMHFGENAHNDAISKKIYYEYLIANKMYSGKFSELFPRAAGEISLVQSFVFDTKHSLSDKTEHLKVSCWFTGDVSPKNIQIVVISVHTNGKATCKSGPGELNWAWEFLHTA